MKTNIRKSGDVNILDLRGKITIGEGDVLLRKHVKTLIEKGEKNVLVNMADVSYMDSSGIGELIASYTTVARKGGKMKLVNLSPKIKDILQITQLMSVFDIYDDEDEAIASFSS
jgi:anti-sigma B factor antagonist